MTVKFNGLTVLGSFTGQLLSGHRCRCTLDVEHNFKVHTDHQFVLQIAVHKCCREASIKSDELSVNEFSFLLKLPTVTVCR